MARRLKHPSDWYSVLCIALWPVCVAALYAGRLHGWAWALVYGLLIYLSLALPVIEHNHMHLRMWRGRGLNRMTDTLLSMLQGRPVFVFHPAHNANHHRHHHGPRDAARTYRFAGGDTNHLWGYLQHPLQAVGVLWPLFGAWLARLAVRAPAVRRYYLRQIGWAAGLAAVMIAIDPVAWLKFVLLPQLLGLHWLLGANYLQHAHADGQSRLQFARNFTGGVNRWFFNIGYHTAHHLQPRLHWSALPQAHRSVAPYIDPRLIERSLLRYLLVTLTGGLLWRGARSRSLMQAPPPSTPDSGEHIARSL